MKQTIENLLKQKSVIINDGAMSTELQTMGFDLNNKLWTATILRENPEAIKDVHLNYLNVGANCIISNTYQASIAGFMKSGCTYEESVELIELSIKLLNDARDEWYKNSSQIYPLVVGSIGPYGAFLADGSEYNGQYGVSIDLVKEFHKERLEIVWNAGVDLLAIETIPSLEEAILLAELTENIGASAWITFSCKDGMHNSEGTLISECVKQLENYNCIKAIGVNCVKPKYVTSLVEEIKKYTTKPIVVYANLGSTYDPINKVWLNDSDNKEYTDYALEWKQAGVKVIGGCCGVSSQDIAKLTKILNN